MKIKINFKGKGTWLIIATIVLIIALTLTLTYIASNNLNIVSSNIKDKTVTLKIYHPNSDATGTVVKYFVINEDVYNKNKNKEIVKVMNSQLGLGINKLVVNGNKGVVDISKTSSENKFDNGSAGGMMAVESLTKTIFANTSATILKVTVDGKVKVEGNHFSFLNDFVK